MGLGTLAVVNLGKVDRGGIGFTTLTLHRLSNLNKNELTLKVSAKKGLYCTKKTKLTLC